MQWLWWADGSSTACCGTALGSNKMFSKCARTRFVFLCSKQRAASAHQPSGQACARNRVLLLDGARAVSLKCTQNPKGAFSRLSPFYKIRSGPHNKNTSSCCLCVVLPPLVAVSSFFSLLCFFLIFFFLFYQPVLRAMRFSFAVFGAGASPVSTGTSVRPCATS